MNTFAVVWTPQKPWNTPPPSSPCSVSGVPSVVDELGSNRGSNVSHVSVPMVMFCARRKHANTTHSPQKFSGLSWRRNKKCQLCTAIKNPCVLLTLSLCPTSLLQAPFGFVVYILYSGSCLQAIAFFSLEVVCVFTFWEQNREECILENIEFLPVF